MADVLLLAAAALLALGGTGAVVLIIRAGRRKRAFEQRARPARLRKCLNDTDDYISRISGALSEDDLDSLERQRNEGD